MINMDVGHIAMQAGINRRCARVKIENTMIKRQHHGIFLVDRFEKRFERIQFFLIDSGKAIKLHRTNIAARSFNPQHFYINA